MRMFACAAALAAAVLLSGGSEAARKRPAAPAAPALTMEAINGAGVEGLKAAGKDVSPALVKAQVLLDRARFSPGTIDGRPGSNLDKAVAAFAAENGLRGGKLEREVWDKLAATSGEPVVTEYALTAEDVKGPFLEKIPREFEDMAKLERLGFTSPRELLAEKFHMSEALLSALNPGKAFDREGTVVVVAAVAARGPKSAGKPDQGEKGRVAKIEVHKAEKVVRALDKEGRLVAFYPASIGSAEKPAPSGTHKVEAVAFNPTYTYNPSYAFKGVKTDRKVTVKPGPNNPVGAVWIDLDIESYGIHGTPEPDKVGKSYSHGCIRLTNWDAQELARMVQKGTLVAFLDD